MIDETRNTNAGMPAAAAPDPAAGQGVGGRHQASPLPGQGGGSPSSCSISGHGLPAARPRDPRVEELRQMGLGPLWIKAADQIGFDDFVIFWRTLSENDYLLDGRNRVTIPSFLTYMKFQHNQVIRSLGDAGMAAADICEAMRTSHKTVVSLNSVKRVLARMTK